MAKRELKCLRCGAEMKLMHETSLDVRDPGIFMTQNWVDVQIYHCPACGKLEFYQPEDQVGKGEVGTGDWWTWKYVPGDGPDVKCPQCGRRHPEDDAFCPGCGMVKAEPVPCKWCGKPLPQGADTCPHCGSRIREI